MFERLFDPYGCQAVFPTLGVPGFLLAILINARKASFTDSESGNTSATSEDSTTTLLPSAKRCTYLPRTPWLKSYSSSMSGSRLALGAFFILFSFACSSDSCADNTDLVASVSVDNHEDTSLNGLTDDNKTVLIF